MRDFLRKRIIRRRNRKALKMLEKLEKVTAKNAKTLTKMNYPAPWLDVLRDVQAINFCADKALKLMRAHVGPRNLFEALVMIKKMAEYEQNLAKKRG